MLRQIIIALSAGPWIALTAMPAAAASPFDGHWSVSLLCPASSDGALPFSWQFDGEVKNSMLRAQHGEAGAPKYLLLSGRIDADGQAQLVAQGVTGTKGYNVHGADHGVPYRYAVPAQFTPTDGTGYWMSVRRCDFRFTR